MVFLIKNRYALSFLFARVISPCNLNTYKNRSAKRNPKVKTRETFKVRNRGENNMKQPFVIAAILTPLLLVGCGGSPQKEENTSASATSASSDQPNNKYLNIYNWSDYVDPQTVEDFSKQHQVTIRYDYYDSNETLEAKVLTGKSGYDIVTPTIGFIGRQIKAGAYQKLDKSKIPNYKNISPALLEKMATVDIGNEYAVPYFWGVNTIGINIDKVKQALGTDKLPDNEWDLIFNPQYAEKLKTCGISILDSQYEVVPIALNYIGKDPMSNNRQDLDAAFDMMKKVRPYIKRFSSSGYIDDMARGDLCVVLGYGGDMHIAKRRAEEAKSNVALQVLAPKSGMGIWLDSLILPKDAQNIDMAYEYINNTLDPKVAAKNGNFVSFAPGSDAAKSYMNSDFVSDPSIFPTDEVLAKSFMLIQKDPDTVKYSVRKWQELKTAK